MCSKGADSRTTADPGARVDLTSRHFTASRDGAHPLAFGTQV